MNTTLTIKQHGALFTADNKLEILKDHKTQTRRCEAGLRIINWYPDDWEIVRDDGLAGAIRFQNKTSLNVYEVKTRWRVNDELYIKEPWATDKVFDAMSFADIVETKVGTIPIWYKDHDTQLDRPGQERGRWRSARFMPKYAARDWLRITAARGERLQSISEEDAMAEGIRFDGSRWRGGPPPVKGGAKVFATATLAYADLWDSINPDLPWAFNPWDIAYTFERITPTERKEK